MIRAKCVLTVVLMLIPAFAYAGELWELDPQPNDPRVPFGKLTVVGGITGPEGVRFALKNLNIMGPVQLTLAAENPRKPLQMSVFKDLPQPLAQIATDASGVATLRFRTDDSITLTVSGDQGAKYQLVAWVSPPVETGTPDAFVAVDQYPTAPAVVPPHGAPQPAAAATPIASPGSPMTLWIAILLGGILLALVAIIVIMLRNQKAKGTGTAAVLLFVLFLGRPIPAQEKPPTAADMKPTLVKPADTSKAANESIAKLRELLEQLEKGGIKSEPEAIKPKFEGEGEGPLKLDEGKALGTSVTATKLLIDFLEQFGLIDPREAAVQPNYNPPGQPLLPSRCYRNEQCGACFADAKKKLDKARTLLENQYVIYRKAELQAGRILEMADAAAGLSPYGKLLWTVQKNNPNEPMNQARQNFYNKYDTNLAKLLDMTNEALIAIGDCERQNFGDYDWYNRYGMVYYNFTRERYTRK